MLFIVYAVSSYPIQSHDTSIGYTKARTKPRQANQIYYHAYTDHKTLYQLSKCPSKS